jgi:hypothetical protein
MASTPTVTSMWVAVADGVEIYRGYSYSDAKDERRKSGALKVIIRREDKDLSPS